MTRSLQPTLLRLQKKRPQLLLARQRLPLLTKAQPIWRPIPPPTRPTTPRRQQAMPRKNRRRTSPTLILERGEIFGFAAFRYL